MVLLDTHAWVWWVHADPRLSTRERLQLTTLAERERLYVSAISVWEVAKLVEKGRLRLPVPLPEWCEAALERSDVGLLELTPDIAIESTRLPGEFHSDPADQIIVATARTHDCPLVTADTKIVRYGHVRTIELAW